jgi:hypothetical protein
MFIQNLDAFKNYMTQPLSEIKVDFPEELIRAYTDTVYSQWQTVQNLFVTNRTNNLANTWKDTVFPLKGDGFSHHLLSMTTLVFRVATLAFRVLYNYFQYGNTPIEKLILAKKKTLLDQPDRMLIIGQWKENSDYVQFARIYNFRDRAFEPEHPHIAMQHSASMESGSSDAEPAGSRRVHFGRNEIHLI